MTRKEIYIFLALLIIGASIIYLTRPTTKDRIIKLSIPIKEQKEKNTDIIGKIYIPKTKLNIEIVQTNNNEYYLNHDLNKKEDVIGTPFLDYRNNIDDKMLIIYGKNSQTTETPFHILEQYLNKDFYIEHPYIILETDTKIKYEITSIILETTNSMLSEINNIEDWKNKTIYINNNSIYNTNKIITIEDQVLLLKTNYYYPNKSNILIISKRLKSTNT